MIDTIALMLSAKDFEILEPEKFSPCASTILHPPYPKLGKGHIFKCVQNPTNSDKKKGIYNPRLTLIQRPCRQTRQRVINLKIELSIPKFMRGNNFDEVTDEDFGLFCSLLSLKLKIMGIKTGADVIGRAELSIVHYSKNFVLQDHLLTRHVLNGLDKLDPFPRLDATSKDYRNNGHLIKWHANSYEICFYDKVKDLKQARISEKRAVDKDQYCQTDLIDALTDNNEQVVRMEVRLNKIKIKSLFKEIGIKPVFTLKHLFSSQISKKVLTYFWQKITGKDDLLNILQSDANNLCEYLDSMQASNPDLKPKDLMAVIGVTRLLQEIGEAGFRAMFPDSQKKSVGRLLDQAKKVQPKSNPRWLATKQVEDMLSTFASVNLKQIIQGY